MQGVTSLTSRAHRHSREGGNRQYAMIECWMSTIISRLMRLLASAHPTVLVGATLGVRREFASEVPDYYSEHYVN